MKQWVDILKYVLHLWQKQQQQKQKKRLPIDQDIGLQVLAHGVEKGGSDP